MNTSSWCVDEVTYGKTHKFISRKFILLWSAMPCCWLLLYRLRGPLKLVQPSLLWNVEGVDLWYARGLSVNTIPIRELTTVKLQLSVDFIYPLFQKKVRLQKTALLYFRLQGLQQNFWIRNVFGASSDVSHRANKHGYANIFYKFEQLVVKVINNRDPATNFDATF